MERWKKELRDKMLDYREKAPEGLWEGIESQMAVNGKKRGVVIPLLWKISSAAAVVLFALIGIRYTLSDSPAGDNTLPSIAVIDEKENERNRNEKENGIIPEEKENAIQDNDINITAIIKPDSNSAMKITGNSTKTVIETVINEAEEKKNPNRVYGNDTMDNANGMEQTENAESRNQQDNERSKNKQDNGGIKSIKSDESNVNLKQENSYLYGTEKIKRARKYTASLYYSGGTGTTGTSSLSGYSLMSYNTKNNSMLFSDSYSIFPQNIEKKQIKADHRQPVTFALSFRYFLNEKWSLESGLLYTYLHSAIDNEGSVNRDHTIQKLNYIGIPVNINYTFWENRRFSFYASAGGRIEKMINGTASTIRYSGGLPTSRRSCDVTIDPLQCSVNASAGAEIKLSNLFGLYAQPGLSYHFRNGSEVETIYKEQPLNFMFNIGVRFSFGR